MKGKVVIGYDHKAVALGNSTARILEKLGFEVIVVGAENEETKFPLQDLIPRFVSQFHANRAKFGVISCGTGVGVEVGVNKFRGIRASLCHDEKQTRLAREYDDANILCLASWDEPNTEEILTAWIETEYDGDTKRREMLDIFDSWGSDDEKINS